MITSNRDLCEYLDIEFTKVIEAVKPECEGMDKVLWAGTVAGFLVKTGFALAAKHGAPREVLEQAALDSIEEAYREKIQ